MSISTTETPPATVPSLLYGDIEDALRESLRAALTEHCPWDRVLARTDEPVGTDRKLWQLLAGDLGVAALPVPEEFGGAGASWREASVVAEELGRFLAPVPFLSSATLATALLAEAGAKSLLEGLAQGEQVAAVLTPFADHPGYFSGPALTWHDGRLSGRVALVAGALEADVLLAVVDGALVAVDAEHAVRTPVVSLDMTRRLADVSVHSAPGRVLAEGDSLAGALRRSGDIACVILAAQQLGVAQRTLEMAQEYVLQRRQFGRLIGSYQAVKHRLADIWTDVAQARAVTRYAAACAAEDSADLPVAASLAQALCSEVAQHAAQECVQLHGGIGFTWEHSAHLYLKRARADALALGTPVWHRHRLARLMRLDAATTSEES